MLEIKNVSKTFEIANNEKRVALNKINLTIEDGEFVTVIGGNGSGKTTLLNIIAGVFPPDSGEILINSNNVTKLKEHKRAKYLGRVFQDPLQGTAAQMSIIENMEVAMQKNKRRNLSWGFKKQNRELFIEKLKELNLGLETRLNQRVGLLSGGQRQALTLLMATLNRPDVLLLDEHTAALDPKTSKIVLNITEKCVKENNLTTIMITHNMKDAITYGDRLIMLHNGNILLDVKGEEKKKLKTDDLYNKFEEAINND